MTAISNKCDDHEIMKKNYELAYKQFINKDYFACKKNLEKNLINFSPDAMNGLLYAAVLIVEGNFQDGLSVIEELLGINEVKNDERAKQEIIDITKHLILYPDFKVTSIYPRITKLHKEYDPYL